MFFAFHGYPAMIRRLACRRTNHDNIRARGYNERGTTTPFDMLTINDLDRFRLVMDVIRRVPELTQRYATFSQAMDNERVVHRAYGREHGDDPEDVRSWAWPAVRRNRRHGAWDRR